MIEDEGNEEPINDDDEIEADDRESLNHFATNIRP